MPDVPLRALEAAVAALLVGQEDAKKGCLLALLARQHALLEGPSGCGKSALASGLARVSGARVATMALHRESRAGELLGPAVLLRRTGGEGERLRFVAGPAPLRDAELVVLDDLPRALGETLLPLLRAVSERRIAGRPLPLECALATAGAPAPGFAAGTPASGAATDPLEPGALDRFAVQVRMHGLLEAGRGSAARALLDAGAPPAPEPAIDTEARHTLQRQAASLPIPEAVREALVALATRLASLRATDGGVLWSDRSVAASAPSLLRAHALLRACDRVEHADLAAVRFMLGRRVPASLLAIAEELIEEAARGAATQAVTAASRGGAGEARPGDAAPGDAQVETVAPPSGVARVAHPTAAADVGAVLRALAGRIEPGRVDRGPDPGGAPRRQARLVRLDELEDADALEALLFVDASLPGAPRVLRRERRRAAGALAILRDVSASMEGRLGRAAAQVVTGLVRLGARRRMRVGYLEFHHDAEPFEAAGAFFHRRYGRLLGLAARERAEGRTSYEAPLRAVLSAFGPLRGGGRHAVLLTDGVPVVGDPGVARERALARRLGIRVHTVYMGTGEPPEVLERIARETGGRSFVLDPASTVSPPVVRARGAA